MTPDPDPVPDRPEPVSGPKPLATADQRAIEAAVAGAAGLLLGRAILGRAGGLVAGLAAVGAGLFLKRGSPGKKPDPTAAAPGEPVVSPPAEPPSSAAPASPAAISG